MIIPKIPFEYAGDKIIITAPCLLTCGCGQVTARWASLQQQIPTKIAQGKPKSSRIINDWIIQEGLTKQWPELKQHTYGLLVAETDRGFEKVNIMAGATPAVLQQIGSLIERSKDVPHNH